MLEVVLAVVQNSQGEVLIIQRAKEELGLDGLKLSWAFPGGKIKPGETKEAAVRREVGEETGYQVTLQRMIHQKAHSQFPVYVYYFACQLSNQERQLEGASNEVKAISWVNPLDLSKYFSTKLDTQVAKFLGLTSED